MEIEYICSAFNNTQFAKHALSEIAFAGRSNVGKSSLINTLITRKNIAYVSKTPGKTKTINFYLVNKNICFADLPGYGFAKVPEETKIQWKELIEPYLIERENLKLVILIIDIRHKPQKLDLIMKQWLDNHCINTLLICTKTDKLSNNQKVQHLNEIKKQFTNTNIVLFSSLTGEGKQQVWEKINEEIKKKVVPQLLVKINDL